MRGLSHGDLSLVARLLWCVPKGAWAGMMAEVLIHANAADRYRKRLGRPHADWGDGSVASYVGMNFDLPSEPFLSAEGYMEAKLAALHGILEWRSSQKRMSGSALRIFNAAPICYSATNICRRRGCPTPD